MEKIIIDENLKGKELFAFLKASRSGLIRQKKSMEKWTDAISFATVVYSDKDVTSFKSAGGKKTPSNPNTLRVKVVANTSLFIDSDMDLLLRDNASKSFTERKGMIKHLKNHGRTLDDQVGDVVDIYYEDIPLKTLGYNKSGTAQALIFETDIQKEYDPKTFEKYSKGLINQHSIGLQYVKMDLAIKDEEDQKEKDFWDKYYSMIINPEAVDQKGYFFVVSEIKLIENSAVLFGSNSLTPTLEAGKSTHDQPEQSTDKEPHEKVAFDLAKAISETKFFN
jgi:hypothetical protein